MWFCPHRCPLPEDMWTQYTVLSHPTLPSTPAEQGNSQPWLTKPSRKWLRLLQSISSQQEKYLNISTRKVFEYTWKKSHLNKLKLWCRSELSLTGKCHTPEPEPDWRLAVTHWIFFTAQMDWARILTALIPESCWESCITTPMVRGIRRVELRTSWIMVMCASVWLAASSARISSMSSSTWDEALSLRRALVEKEDTCVGALSYRPQHHANGEEINETHHNCMSFQNYKKHITITSATIVQMFHYYFCSRTVKGPALQ